MNEASRWRHALAQQLAPFYSANPKVAAVSLGGSVSQSYADRFSDIDLTVYWTAPQRKRYAGRSSNGPGEDEARVFPLTKKRAVGRSSSRWQGSPSTYGT